MAKVIEKISLYFCEGNSDKEYHCSIEEVAGGYNVPFAFGRRGSTLQTGTKTASPVPLEKAKKVYDALVREKTAKGYTPGASGAPYSTPAVAVKVPTGVHCQLLNPIDEHEATVLLSNDKFCAQEKFDGKRMILQRKGGKFTAINRKGIECGYPREFEDALSAYKGGDFTIDGEAVGGKFHVFDCLVMGGVDISGDGYVERYNCLKDLGTAIASIGGSAAIVIAPVALTTKQKRDLLERLRVDGREGIVFKDKEAHYSAGRPASGGSQLKFKFVHTCSAVVTKVNGDKRSVALELDDGGTPVPVGNCTIPVGKKIPGPGDVVEIRYLYAYKGGSLYQPVFLGVRDDIGIEGCALSQLHYKAEGGEGEEE